MEICKLIKKYWYLFPVAVIVITAIFVIGTYYTKIEYMSDDIDNNTKDIKYLERTVNILIGATQPKNSKIDIKAYIHESYKNNISTRAAIDGLIILRKSSSKMGKSYLTRELGFTNNQVSSVFNENKIKKNRRER